MCTYPLPAGSREGHLFGPLPLQSVAPPFLPPLGLQDAATRPGSRSLA